MLIMDWFTRIARESGLTFSSRRSDRQWLAVASTDGFEVVAHFTDEYPYLRFVPSDKTRGNLVDDLITKAVANAARIGFGGIVWHTGSMPEVPFKATPASIMGPLLQRLGSQTRIQGWRRLGGNVLLEFVERESDDGKPILLAPHAEVRVHVAAPAPCEGFLSSHIASSSAETIAALCTFALGRPVEYSHTIFPTREEMVATLDARQADPAVFGLARKGVSLDIFSLVGVEGGLQVFERARAALLTFDAAVRQERDAVASILYVVAAECLTVPNTEWRRRSLTRRFIEFFDELARQELDDIVRHGNYEEAFGVQRGDRPMADLRREALDRIYDYRSGQVHEGIGRSYRIFGQGDDKDIFLRRGLIGDFAEGGILRFLSAPRSTLVGHPKVKWLRSTAKLNQG